ncbi:type II toxin-antitoxin system mRNA interferase toxin, RelE/StbE family [Candidatus Peregrinibacteria bacterium]|nr:type II toxin-antitoxin system mRNA interferase toxin, RelE/StbE family [Candidatus Peregrinibacteria bacterium]
MLEILYKPTFVRQYKKYSKPLQDEIKEKIGLFCQDPNHSFLKTHKLKGKLKDFWSFSVNYEYRIVFKYESKNTAILLAVGDHDVYK